MVHFWRAPKPREWLVAVAPVAKLVGKALGAMIRTSTAGLLSGGTIDEVSKQFEFGQQMLDSITQTAEFAADVADVESLQTGPIQQGHVIEASGAGLRRLHAFLQKGDPGFGGLERVRDLKLGQFKWVHRKFKEIYERPLLGLD